MPPARSRVGGFFIVVDRSAIIPPVLASETDARITDWRTPCCCASRIFSLNLPLPRYYGCEGNAVYVFHILPSFFCKLLNKEPEVQKDRGRKTCGARNRKPLQVPRIISHCQDVYSSSSPCLTHTLTSPVTSSPLVPLTAAKGLNTNPCRTGVRFDKQHIGVAEHFDLRTAHHNGRSFIDPDTQSIRIDANSLEQPH